MRQDSIRALMGGKNNTTVLLQSMEQVALEGNKREGEMVTLEKKQKTGADTKHCESKRKIEVKKIFKNYSKRKTENIVSGQPI